MNWELPDVQAGFRKDRETNQIAHICWIIEKAREFQKNIYFCFIDYAKTFRLCGSQQIGKLSSGHRTGKGQFSFQSQREAMPNNVQTSAQLHSSHTLASKVMLKIPQAGFNSTWMVNFQLFKLDLEKAEEPEIKLPHLLDHWKSKRVPEKHLFLLYWLCQSLWLCGSQQTVENS